MLNHIWVENFRPFNKRVDVQIKPITILVGRNSAGKSSILKFLLMLKQSIGGGDSFLVTEGEDVHLGTFDDIRNSKTKKKYLRFGLGFNHIPWGRDNFISIEEDQNSKKKNDDQDENKSFTISISGISSKPIREVTAETNTEVFYDPAVRVGKQSVAIKRKNSTILKKTQSISSTNLFEFMGSIEKEHPKKSQKDFLEFLSSSMPEFSVYLNLRTTLENLKHLGPIREEFQRTIVAGTPPRADVGKRGEYTLVHLYRILKGGGKRAAFVARHTSAVAHVDNLIFGKEMKGYITLGRGRNKRTGAKNLLADFGCGVSQFLPILVQGALLPEKGTLLVEQPEAHLHSDAHMAAASFFVDLLNERKVYSIIETHSSSFLLRIRHLIKKKKLRPEDVSVCYFYQERGSTHVRNLKISQDGRMEKGLPMEFFGGAILESIKMAGRK